MVPQIRLEKKTVMNPIRFKTLLESQYTNKRINTQLNVSIHQKPRRAPSEAPRQEGVEARRIP